MERLAKAESSLAGYYNLLGENITLKRQGDKEAAVAIYQSDPGIPVWVVCNDFATEARAFEQNRYEQARDRYQHHLRFRLFNANATSSYWCPPYRLPFTNLEKYHDSAHSFS